MTPRNKAQSRSKTPARRPTARAYASPLRASHADQTRDRILEAMVAELATRGDELLIARVAKRAGVALRTVYHHFPNRDAQVEAIARYIDLRLGTDAPPQRPAHLRAFAERRLANFLAHEALVRAQLAPGMASQVRAHRQKGTAAAIDRCVQAVGAPEGDTRLCGALVKHLISADVPVSLLDRHGLVGEDVACVVPWVVELILVALARGEGPASRQSTEPGAK